MARRRTFRFRSRTRRFSHHRRSPRRAKIHGILGGHSLFRGGTGAGGTLQSYLRRPTKALATGLGIGAVLTLIMPPIVGSNGGTDSWYQRLLTGFDNYKASGNAVDIMGDYDNNNAFTLLIAQMKQNAVPAITMAVGAGIVAAIGRKLGV